MDGLQFQRLAEACDFLLCTPGVTVDRIGISWLHVLNEHPTVLQRYRDIFVPPSRLETARKGLARLVGPVRALLQSSSGIDDFSEFRGNSDRLPERIDALFISHLVSTDVEPTAPDFYYGQLPEQLASLGISSLVALMNQLQGGQHGQSARLSRGGRMSRLVLPDRFTAKKEQELFRRAKAVASLLVRESAGYPQYEKKVALEAARHATGGSTIASLRLHSAVKTLCSRFRPRAIVVLWEGHAWERMAFHAAREVDPDILCIGYQHAILFPRAHALKRSLGPAYDPDVILTIGEITRDDLKAAEGLKDIPVLVYGSHRRLPNAQTRPSDVLSSCLVVPDGIESECLILFEFALAAAVRHPELQFVFRTHPVLPFRWLERRYASLRNMPANVRVSDRISIADDFAQCSWALYRGSSAAVHAVLAGARPIYLELTGELRIDPLFGMKGWRKHVAKMNDFSAVIADDCLTTLELRAAEWMPARTFCEQYVVEPNATVVEKLLTRMKCR